MTKYLRCIETGADFTQGKRYKATETEPGEFKVVDDSGNGRFYNKSSDYFARRFTLEIEDGVIVLKDESLGGIEREYREVKRKAGVGERIKITNNGAGHGLDIGYICTAYNEDFAEGWALFHAEESADPDYVVLEKTDIIRSDGERLRMVDRKAAVGERVIAVSTTHTENDNTGVLHRIGEFGTVSGRGEVCKNRIRINGYYVVDGDYRILEPVESAKPLSAQPPLDQAAANIAALTAKVQALESRVDTLEKARQPVKVAEGPADDAPPSFADMPRAKSLQQIRDEIVERAKADVKRLAIGRDVDFVVNREKRAVVALICGTISGRLLSRGIAKCAPNDVFNAHIGRAIALRRALGLEVLAEYLNVPNPEEPRVGDYVMTFGCLDFTITWDDSAASVSRLLRTGEAVILDDSREEVGA